MPLNKKVLAEQALNTLVGLEAAPISGGGFTYTHRDSGFVFEISPVEEDTEDAIMDGIEEMAFNPIKMGLASKVPHYKQTSIHFPRTRQPSRVRCLLLQQEQNEVHTRHFSPSMFFGSVLTKSSLPFNTAVNGGYSSSLQ